MVEGYLAVVRAGGIGVPVNPRSAPAELEYLLADSGARFALAGASSAGTFLHGCLRTGVPGRGASAGGGCGGAVPEGAPRQGVSSAVPDMTVLVAGTTDVPAGAHAYDELAVTDPGTPAPDDLGLDEVAWMFSTSGTTGRPKGVLSTQRNCLWSVAASYVPIPDLRQDDRVLWPLPLFHSLSHIACVLSVTSVGATARITDGSSADDVLDLLRTERATFLAGVPTTYHHLVATARRTGLSLPDLRIGLVGGAVTGLRAAPLLRGHLRRPAGRRLRLHRDLRRDHHEPARRRPRRRLPAGCPYPASTSASSTPAPATTCPPDRRARSGSAAPTSWSATTTAPRRPGPRLRDGWFPPATWPAGTRPATSRSAAG